MIYRFYSIKIICFSSQKMELSYISVLSGKMVIATRDYEKMKAEREALLTDMDDI